MSIEDNILELKKKNDAVILAHNYQTGDIQDIADFVADSLDLAKYATKTSAKVIIFCGVRFMAETASILCPDKTVIMPDVKAGCPMAKMLSAEELRKWKKQYPGATVVCYINTTAEVKAESDICCTSSSAYKIIDSLKDAKEILFVPDQNLGDWVSKQFPDKKFILYPGYCSIHVNILPEYIIQLKKEHPKAEVMVHPECPPATIKVADKVLGTSGMIKYAKESPSKEFIVGTENGLIHRLKKENPNKRFYAVAEHIICPNMKITTMEKILWALEDVENPHHPAGKISLPEDIRLKAKKCIDAMLAAV
jgi:quinolinate synthase